MTFAALLLDWYDAHKRTLPWRDRAHDPYAIWVSEIMLQQTTVAAVIPFYERWMQAFPTIQDLAVAPLDDVLKHWAGLGYYARARNLHRGAQTVVENFGGTVPRTVPELLALPGVGRYTAGAIASIAFNERAPIVDANVARVLCRVFVLEGDPKTDGKTQAQLWQKATELIPDGRAGDFNQAMMELGALICVSSEPKCDACPLRSECAAFQSGQTNTFPQFSNVKKWLDVVNVSAAVFDEKGRVLLVQRPASEPLWGGLWELPRATLQEGESLAQCAARALCETVGLRVPSLTVFGTIKHVVANRRVALHGYTASVPNAEPLPANGERFAWTRLDALRDYALPTPQVKLLALLAAHVRQGRLELD